MLERDFQAHVIKQIKKILPASIVFKMDPNYIQGFPDLLVLNFDRWGSLEVKISETAPFQPNQEYYLELLNSMSWAGVIYPENEEECLYELRNALESRRPPRIS